MVCFCMSVCLSTGWYPSYKLCFHLGSTLASLLLSFLFSHDQQWPTGGCVGIKFQPARGQPTETNENSVALTDCWSNFPPSTGNFIHRPLLLLYLSQPRIQFLFVLWGSSFSWEAEDFHRWEIRGLSFIYIITLFVWNYCGTCNGERDR